MSDWDDFCRSGWYQLNRDLFDVGEPEPALRSTCRTSSLFPRLSELLGRARSTAVRIKPGSVDCFGQLMVCHPPLIYLLGWNSRFREDSLGWVVLPRGFAGTFEASDRLHDDHKALLECFGGIRDYWGNKGLSLISNHTWVFVEKDCQPTFLRWQLYYEALSKWPADTWMFPNPISVDDYVEFAREANGNTSAYHRVTGEVVLYASDHAFDCVTEFPGCPELTLYTVNDCTTFRSWVEKVAEQWLDEIR